ncbi:MAG: hypothetical protein H7A38_01205 [Chlamydiales bacterium]|nr:hypothetical protein [Chlamydiales bacterium]
MKWPFSSAIKFNQKLHSQNVGVIGAFYGLLILPFLVFFLMTTKKMDRLKELEEAVERLPIRLEKINASQKDKLTFKEKYGSIDPYYLDHVIEPMILLKPEVEALKLVYSHPAFQACDNVKKRLEALTRGGNRLMFTENYRDTNHEMEEVYLAQLKPVEINANDLKAILMAVEGVSIGNESPSDHRPQFVIREFHLTKKKLAERETYLLEMQLIKRGPLK